MSVLPGPDTVVGPHRRSWHWAHVYPRSMDPVTRPCPETRGLGQPPAQALACLPRICGPAVTRLSPLAQGGWPRRPPRRPPYSLGHGTPWQPFVSRPLPLQAFPPIWGTGELQSRIRVTLPTPQVAEQEDQGDQWLQPPSCRTSTRERGRQRRAANQAGRRGSPLDLGWRAAGSADPPRGAGPAA